MRICCNCKIKKEDEDFNWKLKGKCRHNRCRECSRKYGKQHYVLNKTTYKSRAVANNKRYELDRQKALFAYLSDKRCMDCGENDPIVLDFDHIEDKKHNVGAMIYRFSWEAILNEIQKCEIVCANCHRRRTAARGKSYRYKFSN